MLGALAVIAFVAVWALVVEAIIRADAKDQAAYDRWFEDRRQVWNQHRQS
jgi:hypothetical protein